MTYEMLSGSTKALASRISHLLNAAASFERHHVAAFDEQDGAYAKNDMQAMQLIIV